jgi:hypothetical protein
MRKCGSAVQIPYSFAIALILLPVICSSQTASGIIAAPPEKAYYALKRVLQTFYDEGVLPSNLGKERMNQYQSEAPYDVITCVSGSDFIGTWLPDTDRLHALADLAGRIVILRNDLRKIGYPEQVWRPILIAFEESQLKLITEGLGFSNDWEQRPTYKNEVAFEERLVLTLNDYHRNQNSQLPEAIREGGCGAGEISIKIRVSPPDGEVLFVPKLLYRYCAAQGVNADDPQACAYWNRAADSTLYDVSGSYQYAAHWPDGASKRGSVDFSKYHPDQIVSFVKP